MSLIYLAATKDRGRGVFAARKITCGVVILRRPYVVFGPKDAPSSGQGTEHYVFTYPYTVGGIFTKKSRQFAIVFGEASLINHSDSPNCTWQWDRRADMHEIIALRDIEYNEELTIDYGWSSKVWDAIGGKL